MQKTLFYQLLTPLLLISLFFFCSRKNPTSPITEDSDRYAVELPAGKLPWPHHWPEMTQSEYKKLIEDLWIINNFGLYQSTDDKSMAYFHDGLDIVLDNGTQIYAIESGYVKSLSYATITIGETSGDNPGYGWAYTHVDNPQVKVGDFVRKGDYIAEVNFEGLPHIHLSRVYHPTKGTWDDICETKYLHPDGFFIYKDTQPPVIRRQFFYFPNNSDEMFVPKDTTVVWGDVDIVVGIRDPGEFAHSKDSGYGDRLCVARIEYEISGEHIQPVYRKSFDFTKIILKKKRGVNMMNDERLYIVYKHHSIFHPYGMSWNKFFSYYVITNTDGTGEFGELDISAKQYAWKTAAVDESNNPKFPNGAYIIKVTVYDFVGNSYAASGIVRVMN